MTAAADIPRAILVVDDEPSILSALESYLGSQGYTVHSARNGTDALELFRLRRPPVVISDLRMPGLPGDRLLDEIKRIDGDTQVIIITGFATIQSAVNTLKAGAFDYLMKPFRLEAVIHAVEKAREHLALLQANRLLQENSLHVLQSMVNTIEQRDYYTAGHSRRVTYWTDVMASALGLSPAEQRTMHLGGLIHDVGKIGIDDQILKKPGKLTNEEYEVIKGHPEKGIQIIEPLEFLRETMPIIKHHHERFDGSGYPGRLVGDRIPLGARILTIADTFDAMTSSRAYRHALADQIALDEIRRCSGTQFDPELSEVFLRVYRPVAPGEGPAA